MIDNTLLQNVPGTNYSSDFLKTLTDLKVQRDINSEALNLIGQANDYKNMLQKQVIDIQSGADAKIQDLTAQNYSLADVNSGLATDRDTLATHLATSQKVIDALQTQKVSGITTASTPSTTPPVVQKSYIGYLVLGAVLIYFIRRKL